MQRRISRMVIGRDGYRGFLIKALFYFRKIGDSAIVSAESPSTINPGNILFLYVVIVSS